MPDILSSTKISASSVTIVRKAERLTKDRAKALVAAGLLRALGASGKAGKQRLAVAGGCTTRCVENAMAQSALLSADTLLNMLDEAPTLLDELLAARGYRLAPLEAAPSADLVLGAGLAGLLGELCDANADGHRDHTETLRVGDRARPLVPQLAAIIREADAIRGNG